ncbi:hypothetical protein PR048_018188 [Dryococelus australis]|uniref:Uncharacterized protein n=1 Tax=Dryococelus australis TaxID=614101 RepID=A0ABQ9HBK9_9NEOP|nr:hypothetical protein PR048_018188 [Dryococelus australis]
MDNVSGNAEANLKSGFKKIGTETCDVLPLLERFPDHHGKVRNKNRGLTLEPVVFSYEYQLYPGKIVKFNEDEVVISSTTVIF